MPERVGIQFEVGADLKALRERVRRFVDDVVIPKEAEVARDRIRVEAVRRSLQAAAREAGLFLPTLPKIARFSPTR